jgi:hypothetical protein
MREEAEERPPGCESPLRRGPSAAATALRPNVDTALGQCAHAPLQDVSVLPEANASHGLRRQRRPRGYTASTVLMPDTLLRK